jgi:hypothetical protein
LPSNRQIVRALRKKFAAAERLNGGRSVGPELFALYAKNPRLLRAEGKGGIARNRIRKGARFVNRACA